MPLPGWSARVSPLSFETLAATVPPGEAVTMWELDRDALYRHARAYSA